MNWTPRKENSYIVLESDNKDIPSFIFDSMFLQNSQEHHFNYYIKNSLDNPINQYYATVRFN